MFMVYVICKNEEADDSLWPGDLEEDSTTFSNRLELYQEAGPLENPVGFMDCQRHRSSPVWKCVQKNIWKLGGQIFVQEKPVK